MAGHDQDSFRYGVLSGRGRARDRGGYRRRRVRAACWSAGPGERCGRLAGTNRPTNPVTMRHFPSSGTTVMRAPAARSGSAGPSPGAARASSSTSDQAVVDRLGEVLEGDVAAQGRWLVPAAGSRRPVRLASRRTGRPGELLGGPDPATLRGIVGHGFDRPGPARRRRRRSGRMPAAAPGPPRPSRALRGSPARGPGRNGPGNTGSGPGVPTARERCGPGGCPGGGDHGAHVRDLAGAAGAVPGGCGPGVPGGSSRTSGGMSGIRSSPAGAGGPRRAVSCRRVRRGACRAGTPGPGR